ncbi:ATP synthase delta-subunit protein [Rhynchospora pubera]|uniref:ATP synthase delta-subunit protein n=1 Tax=Rhynchospora pubera TaxID=906938 RepID=A0AAV8HFL4_9POAL|nr:ATP synthase delta-subunit protein [Rhynchospora pubera]
MSTLRLSPATVSPKTTTTPSSSLRRRSPALRVSYRRGLSGRRGGGGALSCKMSDITAASYAQALADAAQSTSSLEGTMADIEKLEKVFSDPAATAFFSNPTILPDKKKEVIDEIVKTSELQPQTANFLGVVLDGDRIDILPEIVQEFEKSYNRLTNTEVALVSSVVRLESQDLAQIAQAVQKLTGAKNVRIKTVIDTSLVAGFTIRYGDSGSRMIDMSVKKQLEEIASNLDMPTVSLPM